MTKEEFNQKVKVLKWDVSNWAYHQEEKLKRFWNENKQEIVILAPIAVAATEKLIRNVRHDQRLKEERELKEKFVYDRSCGSYVPLKRKLSNKERLELARRKRNGETSSEILSSMRVVKR